MSAIEQTTATFPAAGKRSDRSRSPDSFSDHYPGGERGDRPGAGERRILAMPGSLRRDSYNRRLLQAATRDLPGGAHMLVYEGLKELPPFNEDDETRPAAAVVELRRQITGSDAVLISTPEYNGSLPGQLKNALDWASRPFATNVLRGKPVAVIGATPSPGGTAHANADLRRILTQIGASVIASRLLVPRAFDQLQPDGSVVDDQLRTQLTNVLSALVVAAAGHPPEQAKQREAFATAPHVPRP